MAQVRVVALIVLVGLLLTGSALSQAMSTAPQGRDVGTGQRPSPVAVSMGDGDARFSVSYGAAEVRLEVLGQNDELLFDSESVTGRSVVWPMRDQVGRRVIDGKYSYVLTARDANGNVIRKHVGVVVVDWGTAGSSGTPGGVTDAAAGEKAHGDIRLPGSPAALTGTGSAGAIAKWTSSTDLGNSVMTESSGFIGIGTVSPPAPLTVDSSANTLPPGSGSVFVQGNTNKERIEMRTATNALAGPAVQGRGYSGSIASPSATQAGTSLITIGGSGHNGNAGESGIVTINAGTIKVKAEENWTPSANGAAITFETTPPGNSSTSRAERVRITGSGNVGIGTVSPGSPLTVAGQIESTAGGIKFPDASVQTTAAVGTITGVMPGNRPNRRRLQWQRQRWHRKSGGQHRPTRRRRRHSSENSQRAGGQESKRAVRRCHIVGRLQRDNNALWEHVDNRRTRNRAELGLP
jgi:hypothetical protein